jgi:hypothetical protein
VEELRGVSSLDVEVHVGDFLSFLSRDYFPACVHRVTRPVHGPGRLSFPFLVRPCNQHVMETKRFDPTGSNKRLVEVSGIPCAHLRKLFDARGKRLLDARRDADAKEVVRKAKAKAFREAFLAKGKLSDSDDSSDNDGTSMVETRAQALSAPPTSVAHHETPTLLTEAPKDGAPAVTATAAATQRQIKRAVWGLEDLGAHRHSCGDYLFVFKQHDLHLDHPEEPVTLQTQLNFCYPGLADKRTAFGFRHVHQLDYATS